MRITVKGLSVFAHHGVLPVEKARGQRFSIDIELEIDPPAGDDLAHTVDYAAVAQKAADIAVGERFELIETLAARIAEELIRKEGVAAAEVTVRKPEALMPVEVEWVGVTVRKSEKGGDAPGLPGG
mgnify:CR=1 FL=1